MGTSYIQALHTQAGDILKAAAVAFLVARRAGSDSGLNTPLATFVESHYNLWYSDNPHFGRGFKDDVAASLILLGYDV